MSIRILKQKYTCLMYGEGKRDRNFLDALRSLEKFKHHTVGWVFRTDNYHGNSASDILKNCKKSRRDEDLVLCFVDLDDLELDFSRNFEKKKKELEEEFSDIKIIWQNRNAEDEYVRVIPSIEEKTKWDKNKIAIEKIDKFVNKELWNKILKLIKDKEKELEENKE